jgi:positive regulator of sigma E activity
VHLISKILSYFFALIVIFTTGNIIVSIVVLQDNISAGDGILVFCLFVIMLIGFYYIINDVKQKANKTRKRNKFKDDGVLDDELLGE